MWGTVTNTGYKNKDINISLEQPTVYIRRQYMNQYIAAIQIQLDYTDMDNVMYNCRSTEGFPDDLILFGTKVK